MSKLYNSEYLCKDEEFNNFMVKVSEVNNIVQKLASKDKQIQEIGNIEAQRYLNDDGQNLNVDDNVELKVKNARTLINKKVLENEQKDPNSMSQEAFMKEVEKDADKRYTDKLVRKEKMETFKKQATLAFRRGEFEKALTLYNKAIEQIKDSVLLYNNRALTYINLKLYERAQEDLKLALRLNEDCLKSWLLLIKINFLQNNKEGYERDIREVLERNPNDKDFITDYINNLQSEYKHSEDKL
ncbi:tetratricopeptide repeat protein 12-like [Diabrotica virgifera virgifera]|uniref:Tetratricopeptide repeat protein 12-like n=2 Tax=Diabrotica virgifera virgifera TaxID=50390 RepID=A0ABM5K2N4_DIAVI|nr:tetratricopeptide repeat protein 12-like [Diabrotica virgifera virgifera]